MANGSNRNCRTRVAEITRRARFSFRIVRVGAELQAMLSVAAASITEAAADHDAFAGLEAAYARCIRLREPADELVRCRGDHGQAASCARLLLPCADADGARHHLVGMVILDNI